VDRIYVDNKIFKHFRGWEINHCPVKSDHRLVTTQLTCRPDEKPGKGRWSIPLYLLKTRKFMMRVATLAAQLLKDLENVKKSKWDPTNNIQTLWAKFKLDIAAYGKYCSHLVNETTQQIRTWKAQLCMVLHDEDMPQED
ncbi:hypothetical protein B0H13DRAFT_1566913, partial [Mycena leptocephala]